MVSRNLALARRSQRRAAAVVEMAVVTPLLLTMLFGIIEYGWVFSIKQTVTSAAYEGCRVATLQGTSDSTINNTIQARLAPYGLQPADYTITVRHYTPSDPNEFVQVSVPYSKVSLVNGFFGSKSWSLGSSCTMRKEGV